MKINRILKTACFATFISFSSEFYGQSISQEAKAGANFICECTKTSLGNNGVDISKLLEIYNSYQSQGYLLSKYKADVKRINAQLDGSYSAIETDTYKCRDQFRQKFSSNLSNKEFLSKMQDNLNKNAYTNGPQLIKQLSN